MKASLPARLVNSPLLLACLLLCVGAVAYAVFKTNLAPVLPGYDLAAKPEALVICYRPGCGCEAYTTLWTAQAITRKSA